MRLTRKDVKFEWEDSCELAIMELKHNLTNAHVLIVLDSQEPYIVYPDTSGISLGCVLMNNGIVTYASRLLNHMRNIISLMT